jgi:hypothetical protein
MALLFERAYGRKPAERETARAAAAIVQLEARLAPTTPEARERKLKAWSLYAQTVLAASEFVYVK